MTVKYFGFEQYTNKGGERELLHACEFTNTLPWQAKQKIHGKKNTLLKGKDEAQGLI